MDILQIPLVSIIIVTYNSRDDIDECLKSVENQTYKDFEVIVVDNASSDGTSDYIERNYPFVKLVRSEVNLGYSGGNALGLSYAQGEYITLLNADVAVDGDWLSELVAGTRKHSEAGIIASNILLYNNSRIVNAYGNEVHFTGLVFSRFWGKLESGCKEEYVLSPSGAAFMVRRDVVKDVGFIDGDFFMEFGDVDLALRVLLRGWKCVVMPSSRAYHKFLLKMTPRRYFVLERGRYLTLVKNFSRRTLTLLFPSLVVTEVLSWGFALYRGKDYVASKVAAYNWMLKNLTRTLKKRTKVQKLRRVNDKKLLELMTYKVSIPEQWLKGVSETIIENFFNAFYKILYRIILYLV